MTLFEQQFQREFAAFDQIVVIADDILARNRDKFSLDRARRRRRAAAMLYGRSRKAIDAVRLLAANGFGDDAMVVSRALVNICIDLAYICKVDSDDRTEQWIANGRRARRQMAKFFGLTTQDEHQTDWAKNDALARQWRDVNIEQRADDTDLKNFYAVLYRHGSSFEHSDLWAVNYFLEHGEDGPMLKTEPSDNLVPQSLFAAYTFAQIMVTIGHLFEFDFAGQDAEMLRVAQEGLRFSAQP
jgi:hypothetical protein